MSGMTLAGSRCRPSGIQQSRIATALENQAGFGTVYGPPRPQMVEPRGFECKRDMAPSGQSFPQYLPRYGTLAAAMVLRALPTKPAASSISPSMVKRPKLKRIEDSACVALRPNARST